MLEGFDEPLSARPMSREEVFHMLTWRGTRSASTKGFQFARYTFEQLTFDSPYGEYLDTRGCDWYPTSVINFEFRTRLRHRRGERLDTLGDLCSQIARDTTVGEIKPLRILGRTCAVAGAFLTIRALLREMNVGTADIAPSSPLRVLRPPDLLALFLELRKIVPNKLPDPHYQLRLYRLKHVLIWSAITPVLLSIVLGVMVLCGASPYSLLVLVPVYVFFFRPRQWFWREFVVLEGIETFGDLARAVVAPDKHTQQDRETTDAQEASPPTS